MSYVLAAAKATLSPLRSALCARMHSLKELPPAPGSGCRPARAPKVTAGMSGPAAAAARAIAPAIYDDNDLGMTVLAQGSHSTGPAPAGRAGLMS